MLNPISSPQNPRIKEAARLRDRRGRERVGRTLVDGLREVERALCSGLHIVELFVLDSRLEDHRSGEVALPHLLTAAEEKGAEISVLSDRAFEKLAYGERNEGIIAVIETPTPKLSELSLTAEPLIGIVEGIEKPGNLGAVLRSADGAGLDALICVDCVTDLYNPNVIRASLGTIFAQAIFQASANEAIAWLATNEINVLVARVDGSIAYDQVDYSGATAIVLGSEADGVTHAWHSESYQGVHLPMRGIADSLNISVTAAILFYEATRQRGLSPFVSDC